MTEYYLESEERDASRWVALPAAWPMAGFEDEFPDGPTWSAAAARAVWNDSGLTPGPGEVEELTRLLTYCTVNCPDTLPGYEVFLHLPGPRDAPLPVYVGDYECPGDAEAELLFATAADDSDAVEKPIVEEFSTPRLGAGRRVLRYARNPDDSMGVLAGLRYAWYVKELDLIASVRTIFPDPARVLSAMDDIDALCRGLRYVSEDEYPE